MRRMLLVLLAACGDDGAVDPCAGVADACITLTVRSNMIDEIDQLELDVLYSDRHHQVSTSLADSSAVTLPVITSVTFALTEPVPIGLVAAGKLGAAVRGYGQIEKQLGPGEHLALEITLAPGQTCRAGGDYCGGNELAGSAGTLYRCTDGVPAARGRCLHGCMRGPTGKDDFCAAGPLACVNGGAYCGGNKLAGDPSSLYDCVNLLPANRTMCQDGCVVAPSPADDHCR